MELAMIFIGLPLASYISLVTLPRGRPAFGGIAVAAVAAGILWLTMGRSDGTGFLAGLIMLVSGAIALAALVQGLRVLLGPGRPPWVYPALVVLALVGAGIPVLSLLGL